jgi:hypothetical protein
MKEKLCIQAEETDLGPVCLGWSFWASEKAGWWNFDVGFCNLYIASLRIKNLKSSHKWAFQLLVHFFRSLFFSVLKASFHFCCLFQLFTFQKQKQTGLNAGWAVAARSAALPH